MTAHNPSVHEKDWVRGPADAPLTLLEYGDFECPFCGQAFHELERLERTVGDQVRFVFRHFPLAQLHPHARMAAEAAEAAGAQGKFWEMHDTLFTNQQALDPSDLLTYADDIGLDRPRFSRDLQEHRFAPKVRRDFMQGVRSGVNGTPTIFVNGERWNGHFTAAALLTAIRGDRIPDVEPMTGLPWG
ncbi:MAG TPA: thioredoxin domain-containing protein [Polyangia bacterium]